MKIDLHLHTNVMSPCSHMYPDDLMHAARGMGLDAVCITEHNKIWKRSDAQALADKHGLPVFRGVEITTTGGDILVFGLDEGLDEMCSPGDLHAMVKRSGAVAIAAHPFRGFLLFGFDALQMDLEQAADNPTFASVHGLEVCNSMVTADENNLARKVSEKLGLLQVGGSDAHKPEAVGSCVTVFEDEIHTEQDLVQAILGGRHHVQRLK